MWWWLNAYRLSNAADANLGKYDASFAKLKLIDRAFVYLETWLKLESSLDWISHLKD